MHSEPLYRKIVHQALKRSWHHKHTWIFGFFATILGFGGVIEPLSKHFVSSTNNLVLKLNPDVAVFEPLYTIRHAFDAYQYPGLMLALAIIFGIAFTVTFLWIAATSVAALIVTARSLEEGKDLHLAEGMKAGSRKVLPVLAITFLGRLVTAVAIALIFFILHEIISKPSYAGAALYGFAFVLMTLIAIYILAITTYAILYAVLRKQKIVQAIAAGQRLLHKQWLLTLETALIIFITTLGIGLLGIAATLTALLPVLFCFLLAVSSGVAGTILFFVAISSFVLVCGITITGAFVTTFQTMAWTILFERATEGMAVAKLHRFEAWIRKIFKRK